MKYDIVNKQFTARFESNTFRYISFNNLGLIYYIDLNDYEKAEYYIKESAFNEYPFGQNNYGLINQFYLNNIEKAEYMYKRSAEHDFALSEYNLGYLFEKNNKIQESIQFYIQSSEHEDNPVHYRNIRYFDKRYEISKIFIIRLVNLKLVDYYFSIGNYIEARKYFIKSFKKLIIKNQKKTSCCYKFEFEFHDKCSDDIFSYLKKFILCFPLFNLFNQPNLNLQSFVSETQINNKCREFNKFEFDISQSNEKTKLIVNDLESERKFDQIFYEPCDLFDFIINNQDPNIKLIFIKEIKEIVHIMSNILYLPPYPILFGRIHLKTKQQKNSIEHLDEDLTHDFYDGFI